MGNGAPVCPLPNIGQVPALQAGRMYPSVPKAQDLPSAIQAANALAQVVAMLLSPGGLTFQNNLAQPNSLKPLVGTPGINSAAGADGSPGAKGKAGKKGEDAKNPSWILSGYRSEVVKVENPDDRDVYVVVKRLRSISFADQEPTNATLVLDMGGRGNG